MARSARPLPRFNVGKVSPSLAGRLDLPHYAAAALAAENLQIKPQGGFQCRAGFEHLGAAKHASRRCRLVAFTHNEAISYILEMGHRYLRVWEDGSRLDAPAIATAVTNGAFTSDITGWTDVSSQTVIEAYVPPPSPPDPERPEPDPEEPEPDPEKPPKPTSVTATGARRQVLLVGAVTGSVTGWQYRRASSANGLAAAAWVTIANSAAAAVAHTVTGLADQTTYWFELRAVNEAGSGPASDQVSARTLDRPPPPPMAPPAPTGFTATGGNRQVALRARVTGAVTKWQYRQATTSGGLADAAWQDVPSSDSVSLSHTVTGLAQDTTYWYEVRAVNTVGAGPDSANVSATTDAPPPPPPKPTVASVSTSVEVTRPGGVPWHRFTITTSVRNGPATLEYRWRHYSSAYNSGWSAWQTRSNARVALRYSDLVSHHGSTSDRRYTFQVSVRIKSNPTSFGTASRVVGL